jgi:iron complex outermembrane recepter protein
MSSARTWALVMTLALVSGTCTAAQAQTAAQAACSGGRVATRADRAKRTAASPTAAPQAANGTAAAAAPRSAQAEADQPTAAVDKGGVVTKTSITSDALQSSTSQNTYDAIKNVPGVAPADARGGAVADALQIRGIKLSSTTSYRLDGGLPIVNNISLPIEDKCRIEALKGAGALEFGVASPAGIINYVLKRATAVPVTSITLGGSGYGQLVGAADIGRRFGSNNQYGVRVNLAGGEFGSFVRGAGGTRYLAALAGDWNPSDRMTVQLDYEQFGIDVIEQSALLELKAVKNNVPLPRVPDPTKLLSGPWATSLGVGQNVLLRGEYKLAGGFSLVGEIGRSEGNRPERNLSQIGNYDIKTGLGKETVTLVKDQETVNRYANVQLKNRFESKTFSNDFTFGVNRNERDFNNPQNKSVTYSQNIYNPMTLAAPPAAQVGVTLPNDSHDLDYYFSDTMRFDRLRVFGGVRQISYESDAHLQNGTTTRTTTPVLAPAIGATYDLTGGVAVYASYVKSLEETGQAPANSANAFQVLAPARATQKEIGFRATRVRGISATLGYFAIDKGNATIDPVTNIDALNGTIAFQGLEGTLSTNLSPRLALNLGGQVMRATQHSPRDPSIDNKVPENIPNVSDNIGLAFKPAFLPGLTLTTGMLFIGSRQVNPQDQGTLPSVTTNSLGANYVARIAGHRYAFNANCTNLLNKRYFSSAVNGALGIGAPRTITFTTRLEI